VTCAPILPLHTMEQAFVPTKLVIAELPKLKLDPP
jgi:hypothetical protein